MAMTRSVLFGSLAALGVPTVTRLTIGPTADFIRGISHPVSIADINLRWSWAIFAVVTFFAYTLLLLTKDR